jgi:hypothetical protein
MKVERLKITGWEDEETGLLVAENEEWLVVRHIPVDYVVDGYKLYRKAFMEARTRTQKETLIERVLRLKGVKAERPTGFEFKGIAETLQWCEQKYGLFEFQDSDQTEVTYGRINQITNGTLMIDMITTTGEVDEAYEYDFELDAIRVITFETDYFESIRLLSRDEQKTKGHL